MSRHLLDANVLIALTIAEHEHHDRATRWFAGVDRFALCPVVEGALIRSLIWIGESVPTARTVLQGVRAHAYCEFCPDTLSYLDVDLASVRGHRDVADAYLVGLAQANEARVATLDLSLADCYPDEALLLPG